MGIVFFKRRTDPFFSAGGVLTAGCESFPTYWVGSSYGGSDGYSTYTDFTSGQDCPGTSYSAYFPGNAGSVFHKSRFIDTTYENGNFTPIVSQRKNIRIEGTLNIYSGAGGRFSLAVKNQYNYGYDPTGYEICLNQTQGFTTASIMFRTYEPSIYNHIVYDLGSVPTGSVPGAFVTLRMDKYSTNTTTDVIKIYRKIGGMWSKLGNDIILTPGNGFKTLPLESKIYQGYVGKTVSSSPQNTNGSIRNVSITVASASLPLPD